MLRRRKGRPLAANDEAPEVAPGRETDPKYHAMCIVMGAVGRLTPGCPTEEQCVAAEQRLPALRQRYSTVKPAELRREIMWWLDVTERDIRQSRERRAARAADETRRALVRSGKHLRLADAAKYDDDAG